MGTKIHTVTMPNGKTGTRKSKGREYVACVVVERTQKANEAERADLEAKLVEAQAHLDTFPTKGREDIKVAAEECDKEREAKYEGKPYFYDFQKDGRRGTQKYVDDAWAAWKVDGRTLQHDALRTVMGIERALERIPSDGACYVNSWHMSLAQAQKTAGTRNQSMARIRDFDKVHVITDVTVRETAGKKAVAPKNVTPKRLEGLRVVERIENGRDPRSMHNSVLYGRMVRDLLAMGLIVEGEKVTIEGVARKDDPGAEFCFGVRNMQLYRLTEAGREALAKAGSEAA